MSTAVIVVVVIGLSLLPPSDRNVGGPTPSASQTPTPSPSRGPTPTPVLIWSPAALDRDWPVPIRPEPAGDVLVVPLEKQDSGGWQYTDSSGDIGSSVVPWMDIVNVHGEGPVYLDLAGDIPLPVADPTERWIAYGLVLDTNRDGVPDVRLGIDNIPGTGHRAWRTDLATGQTLSAAGPPYGEVGIYQFPYYFFHPFFPGEGFLVSARQARFSGAGSGGLPFYAWAALIEGGRVVATDYAPDFGWLDPRPAAPRR